MTLKMQTTSFQREEIYDQLTGQWVRKVKPNNTFNLMVSSTASTTTGSITLTSSVVATGEVVTIYSYKVNSNRTITGPVNLQVGSAVKAVVSGLSDSILSTTPIAVATAGQTVSVVAVTTTTNEIFHVNVIGLVEPAVARMEH